MPSIYRTEALWATGSLALAMLLLTSLLVGNPLKVRLHAAAPAARLTLAPALAAAAPPDLSHSLVARLHARLVA